MNVFMRVLLLCLVMIYAVQAESSAGVYETTVHVHNSLPSYSIQTLHLRKNPKKPAVSWHTTLHAKCSVLYLLWALTLERCWAGQGLACGMRAGGFCGQAPRKHRALQEQKPPDREELGQECLQPCGRLPASTSHKRDTHPAAADHSHGSRASRVSFGSLSLSQPRRYAKAFPVKHVGADGIPVSKPDDPCGSVLKIEYHLAPFAVAVCLIQVGSGGDPEPNGSESPRVAGSHLYKA